MTDADFIGPPCDCPECQQAGVAGEKIRRDPQTGRWLHGYPLKRWLMARDAFISAARRAAGRRGRHSSGFEPLIEREPGMEG